MSRKACRGSMTVMFCLLTGLILSLSTACIWSVQHAMFRFRAAESMDLALYSLFGQYDRDILEQYDLFFLDASYGSGQLQLAQVLTVMESYVNKNGHTLESGGFTEYALATDQKGNVWKEQAVSYMKEYAAGQMVGALVDELIKQKQVVDSQETIQGQQDDTSLQLQYEQKLAEKQTAEEETASVPKEVVQVDSNPIDVIKEVKKMGILALVLPDSAPLSGKEVTASQLLSHRNCSAGMGMQEEISFTTLENLLYQEYCLGHLGCFGAVADRGILDYQIEYMLGGKSSDEANLKWTVQRLLWLREASNYAFLASDSASRQQLSAFALALATSLGIPEAYSLVEVLLRLCWAYGESLLDVRILLSGGSVPLVKDTASWNLSLERLSDVLKELDSAGSQKGEGLSYQEYLRLLLYTQGNTSVQTMRSLDMIEGSLRCIPGKESFQMDHCLRSLTMEGEMPDLWGQRYTIQRSYDYVMN